MPWKDVTSYSQGGDGGERMSWEAGTVTIEDRERRATYIYHVVVDESMQLIRDAKDEIMGQQGSGKEFSQEMQERVSVLNFVLSTLSYAKRTVP